MPTLVWPSSRAGAIAAQVAASHQASSRGVPSTGRLPEPDGHGGVGLDDGVVQRGRQAGDQARAHCAFTSKVDVRPPASSMVTGPNAM